MQIIDSNVGYELRSYPPIPFDIDYTRSLGYGAAKFLLTGLGSLQRGGGVRRECTTVPNNRSDSTGGLICLVDGRIEALPFSQLRDPSTGRTKVRTVDIDGDGYRIARKYMIPTGEIGLGKPGNVPQTGRRGGDVPGRFRTEVQGCSRVGRDRLA